ncbi:SH3 domain-containing protein [Nocardioides dilutus]
MAHSHKRETNARRKPRAITIVAPLALMATVSTVGLGVLASDPVSSTVIASAATTGLVVDRADQPVTRSTSRGAALDAAPVKIPNAMSKAAIRTAIKNADTRLWTTDELNIWDQPGDKAEKLGELDAGKKVLVTGREMWGRSEIVLGGKSRWVTSGYFSDEKPPTLGGECTNGSSIDSGVSSSIVAIHRAVCANFPEITSYGTLRGGGGDHGSGRAIDIMVSGARGWEVANFVRENYVALGVSYVIYSQRIWSVERGGEGWRGMSNRGSATANHYDHVHVSVF